MQTKRGTVLKKLLAAAGVLALLCVGFVVFLWVRGGGTPNVAVDYVAKLNERAAGVPEDQRAWPIYLRAVASLPHGGARDDLDALIKDCRPGDAGWAACVDTVEEHAEVIGLIREAASKPELGMILEAGTPRAYLEAVGRGDEYEPYTGREPAWMFDVLLPQLSELRRMARLLRVDALHAAEQGDGERVVADFGAIAGLARHIKQHPLAINQIVFMKIGTLTSETVEEIVLDFPGVLGDAELERIDRAIASAFAGPGTALDITAERYSMLDFIQRLYTDDGHGGGCITAAGLRSLADRQLLGNRVEIPTNRLIVGFLSLVSTGRAELTREVNAYYDLIEARAATPMWERTPDRTAADFARFSAQPNTVDIGRWLIGSMLPALGKMQNESDRLQGRVGAARVAIALERFRLANGHWPASLDALIPTYLGGLPADPFTGDPLRYVLGEDGPVVYSVGADREDDAGRASEKAWRFIPADQIDSYLKNDPDAWDGDWVLFPPPAGE